MKTIKLNNKSHLAVLSGILVKLTAISLFAACPFCFYEPENPKLKKLK